MYGLALCAGVGGIELGLKLAEPEYRTICYVEREAYAVAVLRARMEDKTLDEAPIWDDVQSFDGKPWRGKVDVITAGFPCQPWSFAGKQKGTEDERWIWSDILRVVCEVRPQFVYLENVPGLVTGGGLQIILGDLTQAGYDAEWMPLSAAQIGANHKRERIWILGHTQHARWDGIKEQGGIRTTVPDNAKGADKTSESQGASSSKVLANSEGTRGGRVSGAMGSPPAEAFSEDDGAISECGCEDVENACMCRQRESRDVCEQSGGAESTGAGIVVSKGGVAINSKTESGCSNKALSDPSSRGLQGAQQGNIGSCGTSQGERCSQTDRVTGCSCIGKPGWWAVEPSVGGSLDGFSSWLDEDMKGKAYIEEAHKSLMGDVVDEDEARTREILQILWNQVEAEALQWKAGGYGTVHPKEVLFTYLCKLQERESNETRLQLEGKEAPKGIMRSMQTNDESNSTSCGPGHPEQSQTEYSDSMQTLSRLLAHIGEEAWLTYRWKNASPIITWPDWWEEGVSRVAHGVAYRVDRLRACGNGVVPLVAATTWRILRARAGV